MAHTAHIGHHDGAHGPALLLSMLAVVAITLAIGLTAPKAVTDFIADRLTYQPVEPPPAEFAGKPGDVPGVTERRFDTKAQVDAACREKLGELPEGDYFRACYVEAEGLIVLPSKWAVYDRRELADLRAHEWAHARGWRHPLVPLNILKLVAEHGAEAGR